MSPACAPALAAPAPTERTLGDRDFERFQRLIHDEAGIWLAPQKAALLVGRLSRRLRELELASFAAYHERVTKDPAERVRMLDLVTTNETHFFREPRQFELLATSILPRWRAAAEAGERPRRIRVWSAACSTGEEPYSLAMTLLRAFPPGSGWELDILATDLSTRVLAHAQAGVWPLEKAREIPEHHLKDFMLRGTGEQAGRMRVGPEIAGLVRFARHNLLDGAPAGEGPFDLLFLRNVLIYFDAEGKADVVSRLAPRLAQGGYFFLGHAETLAGVPVDLAHVGPSIYLRRA